MNESRTCDNSDTSVARGGSRSVRDEGAKTWIVRDNGDNAWGPFPTAAEARSWASGKWPDIPEYRDATHGGGFWDIEAIWTPDAVQP